MSVQNLTVENGSIGANLAISNYTEFQNVTETDSLVAVEEQATNETGIQNLVANDSLYGVLLVGTNWTNISGSQFYADDVGVILDGANSTLTGNDFTQCIDYAVVAFGVDNLVYFNYFVGNDGSNLVYNPATIQAYSTPGNTWDTGVNMGNYWADWHSYNSMLGRLNPYPISNGVSDEYPLGTGPSMHRVDFVESGLPSKGKSWTIQFAGESMNSDGTGKSPTIASVNFSVPAGVWDFYVAGPRATVSRPSVGRPARRARSRSRSAMSTATAFRTWPLRSCRVRRTHCRSTRSVSRPGRTGAFRSGPTSARRRRPCRTRTSLPERTGTRSNRSRARPRS